MLGGFWAGVKCSDPSSGEKLSTLVDCLQIADRPRKSVANDFKMVVEFENPQVPSQEKKLEWVTPKISLMEAGDTEGGGKFKIDPIEFTGFLTKNGPS